MIFPDNAFLHESVTINRSTFDRFRCWFWPSDGFLVFIHDWNLLSMVMYNLVYLIPFVLALICCLHSLQKVVLYALISDMSDSGLSRVNFYWSPLLNQGVPLNPTKQTYMGSCLLTLPCLLWRMSSGYQAPVINLLVLHRYNLKHVIRNFMLII